MSTTIPRRKIRVYVAATYFSIEVGCNGRTASGVDISQFVRNDLTQSEYDYNMKVWIPMYNYSTYDKTTGMAYFPRYTLPAFVTRYQELNDIEQIQVPPVVAKVAAIPLKSSFKLREHQVDILKFLTSPGTGFTPLSAACGTGKTASTIAAISALNGPALIILGMLIDQWYSELKHFTTLTDDDIVIIKGYERLSELWKAIEHGYAPKVVIFSTRTLALYCINPKPPYDSLPSYLEFQKAVGFKTKVFDECHTNFYANTKIDLKSNIERNIYLSATYARSDRTGLKIFNMVYPPKMRYGENSGDTYTTVLLGAYTLSIPPVMTTRFKVAKGYLHPLYETFLLKHKRQYFKPFVTDVLMNVIQMYYLNKKSSGQKLLILCRTKKFVTALVEMLTTEYGACTISAFFSGDTSAAGNRDNLVNSDIIISTMNSCATGVDIKGLKTCINTVSYASAPLTAQALGRLRRIEGEDTIFVDLYNVDIQAHKFHLKAREHVYRIKAKSCTNIRINF